MAKRKHVLSETRHRVSCACGFQLVSQDPAASALRAHAAAPRVWGPHLPAPRPPDPQAQPLASRTETGAQETLGLEEKLAQPTNSQSKYFIKCSLRLSKQEGPESTCPSVPGRTGLVRAEEGPHLSLSGRRRLLPSHAAFPSPAAQAAGSRGHTYLCQVRRGRGAGLREPDGRDGGGSSGTAPGHPSSSSLLQSPESPQSPSARRFLILGNFLNAPWQALNFLPAAAPRCPRPALPPVRPQRPAQGIGRQSAPEPGSRGRPERRGRRGEGKGARWALGPNSPGAGSPDEGASYAKRGHGQQLDPLATCPACCVILPRTNRHSGSRPFPVQLFGKRILFTVWSIPNHQPKTLLLTGDRKARVVLTGGLLT
ncbi:uncharacterized protein LOC122431781 [Cervus canadensis]|uniref:uncharacterized protein LOC122431781 n=1 Tax=Cervus canadensis TaxID=1574408 RepID=UPI001CA352C1|nr:uncharacterized protein LOC122431781 [Cervus canadensis]